MGSAARQSKTVGQDMLRLRIRGCLESISAEEGLSEAVARIRFVQFSRQAATRLGLRKWKSNAQSEQEAGEESLTRFLDGVWEYRNGKRGLENGNAQWVLHIWEVGCEESNREQRKPKQLRISEKDDSWIADPLAAGLIRHAMAGRIRSVKFAEGSFEVCWPHAVVDEEEEWFFYDPDQMELILDALTGIFGKVDA